jgi:hypothetical protein
VNFAQTAKIRKADKSAENRLFLAFETLPPLCFPKIRLKFCRKDSENKSIGSD